MQRAKHKQSDTRKTRPSRQEHPRIHAPMQYTPLHVNVCSTNTGAAWTKHWPGRRQDMPEGQRGRLLRTTSNVATQYPPPPPLPPRPCSHNILQARISTTTNNKKKKNHLYTPAHRRPLSPRTCPHSPSPSPLHSVRLHRHCLLPRRAPARVGADGKAVRVHSSVPRGGNEKRTATNDHGRTSRPLSPPACASPLPASSTLSTDTERACPPGRTHSLGASGWEILRTRRAGVRADLCRALQRDAEQRCTAPASALVGRAHGTSPVALRSVSRSLVWRPAARARSAEVHAIARRVCVRSALLLSGRTTAGASHTLPSQRSTGDTGLARATVRASADHWRRCDISLLHKWLFGTAPMHGAAPGVPPWPLDVHRARFSRPAPFWLCCPLRRTLRMLSQVLFCLFSPKKAAGSAPRREQPPRRPGGPVHWPPRAAL